MPKVSKPATGLAKKLQGVKTGKSRKEPLWKGPEKEGITQSLLSRFLVCPERFRLLVVEGLKTNEQWDHRLGYGNLWHTCEEALAGEKDWLKALQTYAAQQCREYPSQQQTIEHWYQVCKVQFPVYVDYWKKHPDVTNRTPLLAEQVFAVPYTLPSGRVVILKGKFDSVDLVKQGKQAAVWLQENKTKGDIKEQMLQTQLKSGFDLQTMFYLIALVTQFPKGTSSVPVGAWDNPIAGVRYNVIRRPLSGGKGSIKQHQPSKANPQGESKDAFYQRLADDYLKAEPEYWFMRWNIEISQADIERFKRECLNPILERLCQWWDFVSENLSDPFGQMPDRKGRSAVHSRLPFGIYNPIAEGGASELDEYLLNGNEVGLMRTANLFPELT